MEAQPSGSSQRRAPRWQDSLVAGTFLLVLAAPLVDMLLRDSSARSMQAEMRSANPAPDLPRNLRELESWPARFGDFYQDSFGLRDVLIGWHNRLKWFGLGESPTDRLVLGQHDWVFYTRTGAIETFRTPRPFLESELEDWALMLEARRAWLAARGIEYLFVLVPDKSEVYSEFMPEALRRAGPGRREQFLDYMSSHSKVDVLDLMPALQAERAFDSGGDLTYAKFGTHWTERGALAGYRAIMERVARHWPQLQPWPREAFEAGPGSDAFADSWTGRLYLTGLLDEEFIAYTASAPEPARRVGPDIQDPMQAHYAQDDDSLPRAVVLHDSFGRKPTPHLARHFAALHGYWQSDFEIALIEQHAPDIVIQIFVDGTLHDTSPALAADVGAERLRADFAASRESLLLLEPQDLPGAVQPFGATTLRPLSGEWAGLEIVTHSGSDLFYLPSVESRPGARLVLELDITSPIDTVMTVLYTTATQSRYMRENSYSAPLSSGRNTVHVHLAASDLQGRLLVRPGLAPGTYSLQRAELRACAR